MARNGRAFEEAVCTFVRSLGPHAKVYFDHCVPDVSTGQQRQVDVWIEFMLMNHFPCTVHISCKDHARALDVTAIDTFQGEWLSTGANVAVLYSSSGFTAGALRKAVSRKIQCCRLYQDEPPELPSVSLLQTYIGVPEFHIVVTAQGTSKGDERTWWDLFHEVRRRRSTIPLEEQVARRCAELCPTSKTIVGVPENASCDASNLWPLPTPSGWPGVHLRAAAIWKWYVGAPETNALRGSFNHLTGEFSGTVTVHGIGASGERGRTLWLPAQVPAESPIGIRGVFQPVTWPAPQYIADRVPRTTLQRPASWKWSCPWPAEGLHFVGAGPNGEDMYNAEMSWTLEFRGRPGDWEVQKEQRAIAPPPD